MIQIKILLLIAALASVVDVCISIVTRRRTKRALADIQRRQRNADGDMEAFNDRLDALADAEADGIKERIKELLEEERVYDQAELDAVTRRLLEKQSRKMYICLDCDASIVTSAVLQKCGDCGGNNFEIRGPVAS